MDDDIRTDVAWSVASKTDQLIFNMLSNSDRVDVAQLPATSLASLRDESEERVRDITDDADVRLSPVASDLGIQWHRFEDTRSNPSSPRESSYRVVSPLGDDQRREVDEERSREAQAETERREAEADSERREAEAEAERRREAEADSERREADAEAERRREAEAETERREAERREADAEAERREVAPSVPPPPPPLDDDDAKRSVLIDIYNMEQRGIKMTRKWTMDDRLEDMLLEVRRHVMAEDETKNVSLMRDGLRLFVSGIEIVNSRLGLLDLEGWSGEVSRDLEKHDENLGRIYRKYCRRSTSRNPETEIAMAIASSMGMHHVKRMMAKTMLNRAASTGGPPPSRRQAKTVNLPKHLDEDSSDEDVPDPRS